MLEERELRKAIAEGLSVAQLAEVFGCSKGSVRYWLQKYGLRTVNPPWRTSTPEVTAARAAGLPSLVQDCPHHGPGRFVREAGGYYRCARCRGERVSARRRRVKELLVAEAGGHCLVCGYDRCVGALEFHHLDPSQKLFAIAGQGVARSLTRAREEVASACYCAPTVMRRSRLD